MCFSPCFLPLQKAPPIDIVLLQDPPPPKNFLLVFVALNLLPPPVGRPRVAGYVSQKFLHRFPRVSVFSEETDHFIALDVFTPWGSSGLNFPRSRVGNSYARPLRPAPPSVSPEASLLDVDYPYLVASDFNIHNSATDPSRLHPSKEEAESAPYWG